MLSLLAPWLAGAAALHALGIRARNDRLAFAGWAWLTGALLTAAITAAWLLLRPFPGAWLPRLLAVTSAVLLARTMRADRNAVAPTRSARSRERWLLHATFAALLLLLASAAVTATTTPVISGDEATIWAAKAKSIYLASDYVELRNELHARVCHPDYPMLNPLLQAWMFAGAGGILDFHARLPIQACTIAMLCILTAALRQVVRPCVAALVLLLFFTHRVVLENIDRSNADLMIACGAIASLDGWLRARAGDARGWPLACIGLTVLVWSKNEGMALALLLVVWFGIQRRRLPHRDRMALAWLALPVAALAVTAAFALAFDLSNDIVPWDAPGQFLGRLIDRAASSGVVARGLAQELLAIDGRWVCAGFLALVLLFPRRIAHTAALPIAGIAAGMLLVYLVAFVGSPNDLGWHLFTAGHRLAFHVSAVAAVGLAFALAAVWPRLACRSAGEERIEVRGAERER